MLSREFTQMIGELIEKSLFKTQWVGNKNFLGLLGFLLRETLSAKHTLRERELNLAYKRSAIALSVGIKPEH
jgi:hypothetical protein